MSVIERARQLERDARAAAFRAYTVGRVGLAKQLHRNVGPRGALTLARGFASGKPNPSLIFRFHAANAPHRIGLTFRDRDYGYYELDELIDRSGAAFAACGLRRGDAVVFMLKNRPELIFAQVGLGRLGGSAVTVSYRSTPRELAFIASHSGAKAVLVDAEHAHLVAEARAELPDIPPERWFVVGGSAEGFASWDAALARARGGPPDGSEDAAVVTYTSGTTGRPKGAVRKFPVDAMTGAFAFIGETPMGGEDVHLAVCPLYHATAFGFVSLSYILGARVVVAEHFEPEAFLELVQRYRVTTTAVVPTMLHRILELGQERIRRYDTRSLRAVFSGGAPLPGPLAIDFMRVFGPVVFNFYGATETGLVTLAKPDDLERAPGTIGRVIPGVDVRLFDEAGRACGVGEVGELCVKSPLVVEGYHADAGATRGSLREGYFSVGDLARRDGEGRYFIEGRKRDMIISGGVNVYPAEVETVLEAHPAVAEVAVVGVPDREWGERVRAFVVVRPGATLTSAEVVACCKAALAGPKVPRDVVFLDSLPRNPTGKVLKRELRELSTTEGARS